MKRAGILLLAALASPAAADSLAVSKTATVISDPLGNAAPKSLPGALVDYRVRLTNPAGNLGQPVRNLTFEDRLPANVVMRVADLGAAGSGPVAFSDGGVLGLIGSGLSYSYAGLASTTDGLEFFDGASWAYVPQPDGDGFDARVRGIRVRPTTTFSTGGSFELRFRVKLR